jgi:hypothetical protein
MAHRALDIAGDLVLAIAIVAALLRLAVSAVR